MDATEEVTGGTVIGFRGEDEGVLDFSFTGVSFSATSIGAFFDSADSDSFLAFLLADADTVTGASFNDGLLSGAGNDVVNGLAGADNDILFGFGSHDSLFGGGGGSDTLLGNDDNDSLTGGGDTIVLQGVVVADLHADDFIFG